MQRHAIRKRARSVRGPSDRADRPPAVHRPFLRPNGLDTVTAEACIATVTTQEQGQGASAWSRVLHSPLAFPFTADPLAGRRRRLLRVGASELSTH